MWRRVNFTGGTKQGLSSRINSMAKLSYTFPEPGRLPCPVVISFRSLLCVSSHLHEPYCISMLDLVNKRRRPPVQGRWSCACLCWWVDRAAAHAASIILFAKVRPTLNSESESATGKLKGSLDVLASGDKHNQTNKRMVKPRVIIQ